MCEAFDADAHECAGDGRHEHDALPTFLIAPFEFDFMRRALVGTLALALGAGPIGVFLMLRRMSLMGDAMAHAILPGAAVGFLVAGLNLFAMTAGGLIAGLVVALLAGVVARVTELKEDASLAAFFLVSLAIGVTIVSARGTNIDLLHFLFGNVLGLDDATLVLIAAITTLSLVILALIWRPLVLECVDPGFLRSVSRAGAPVHIAFLGLVVLNLVGGFHALGTLLAVGLMMLPAVAARFWSRDITTMIVVAVRSARCRASSGLLLSFHAGLAAGPAVILIAGMLYIGSARRLRRRSAAAAVAAPPSRSMMRCLVAALVAMVAAPAAQGKIKVARASRSSPIWCATSVATASRSPRWSDGTTTPTASCRRRRTPGGSPRQSSSSSTDWASRVDSIGSCAPRAEGAGGRRERGHRATRFGDHSARSARLAVGRQRQALRRQYPRRADHGRSCRQESYTGKPAAYLAGSTRSTRRSDGAGGDPGRPTRAHHQP